MQVPLIYIVLNVLNNLKVPNCFILLLFLYFTLRYLDIGYNKDFLNEWMDGWMNNYKTKIEIQFSKDYLLLTELEIH